MNRLPKPLLELIREALADAWDAGHQQGQTDSASYDAGGKYRGNPWRDKGKGHFRG